MLHPVLSLDFDAAELVSVSAIIPPAELALGPADLIDRRAMVACLGLRLPPTATPQDAALAIALALAHTPPAGSA